MDDIVERAFLAALQANINRPELLALDTEEALDAYVSGLETAAICVATEFERPDLIVRWIHPSRKAAQS